MWMKLHCNTKVVLYTVNVRNLMCVYVWLFVCLFLSFFLSFFLSLFVCLFVCYAFIYIQIGVESLPPLCIKRLCLCRNSPTWRGLSHLLRPLQVRWCRDAVRMLRICPSWNEGWSTLSEGELRLNSWTYPDLLDSTNIWKMVPAVHLFGRWESLLGLCLVQ